MEDTALLKRVEFLRGLGGLELAQINRIVKRTSFSAGEEIVREGTPCDAFYIIKDGTVDIYTGDTPLVTLGPGDPVGEVSFIDQGLRSATVVASSDVVLLRIPSAPFQQLLDKDNGLALKIFRSMAEILCRKLRETNQTLALIQA